jgi:ABC-type transporter Mla subunit MlaD
MIEFGLFLALGQWVENGIVPLFEIFRDDRFAPMVAFILLCSAIVFGVYFFVRHAVWIRYQLDRRTRLVRSIQDYGTFAREIANVERALLGTKLLRHAWAEFKETLIFPDGEIDGEPFAIRNTARPHDYFNSVEAGLHFRFYRSLPNLFVGLGLLFTFIGLVSALYFATKGIEGADIAQTQSALHDLLHAATFKFYTSVAGLAGSIILGLILRWGTNVIEGGFDNLSQAIEEKILRVTSESIAFRQYLEAREQTRNLRRFNDEVALTVGKYIEDALNNSLPTHLSQAMEPVARTLEEVTTNLSRMNEDALRSMADGFGRTIQGAAGDQIKGLANVVGEIKGALDGMREKMDQGGAELAENVRRSTEDMRGAIIAMTGAINEVSAKIEGSVARGGDALDRQLETASQTLNAISDKIAASLEGSMSRMSTGSEEAAAQFVQQLATAATALQSSSERMAARIEGVITEIADAARAATERVSEDTAQVGKALSKGAEVAGKEAETVIRNGASELVGALQGVADELKGSVREMTAQLACLARELREVEGGMVRQRSAIEGVVESAKSTETAMMGAAKSIRDASAPLASASQGIAEASRNIETSIRGAVDAIEASQQHTRAMSDRLGETFEALQRVWANYEKRFDGVDESLERAFTQIIQHVESNVDALHKFVTQIDGKLSETVERLGGGIEELGEFTQLVDKATQQLRGSVDALARLPN